MAAQPRRSAAASGHAACAFGDGQVLAFGGHNGQRALSDIYVLDLATRAWRERQVPTGHPLARSGHTVTLAGEARFLICGGFSRTGFINDVHALDVCPRHVRRLEVVGGPHSSAVRKAAVEFSGADGRALPLAVQWFRSKNGGPFLRVPGATGMAYAPTADDIHARLGVACHVFRVLQPACAAPPRLLLHLAGLTRNTSICDEIQAERSTDPSFDSTLRLCHGL